MKRCSKCQVIKPLTEFRKKASANDGLHPWCKPCHSAAVKADYEKYRDANPDEARRKNREKRRRQRETPATWCGQILTVIRSRAEEKSVPFDLTPDYLRSIWPADNRCPALRTEFTCGCGKSCGAGPSVDRVKPELGYVKGNVRIISYRANRIKCDATLEELLAVVDYVKQSSL